LDVLEVWYEDLVGDYERQLRAVLRHIGIERDITTIPTQPLERQSGPLNERVRIEVLAYLGVHDRA
jgi:hypothetical protein